MAHSPKDALLAAKEDLLAAYSSVHSSLGRLIDLVHSSEPRVIADVLGSESDRPSQSPPHDHLHPHPLPHHRRPPHLNGLSSQSATTSYPPRSLPYPEPPKYPTSAPLYPAPPPLTQSSTATATTAAANPHHAPPPASSLMSATPGATRQLAHSHQHSIPSQKPRQRKSHPQPSVHPSHASYASQPVQPLETDEDEDEDDDAEEPMSDEEHMNGSSSATYYHNHNPPRQSTTIPTPPGSIPGGKKKRVKRERDPNAPKRPASAYILFQNAVRQEMRAANPTADYKELARQIGDRWKNLSEEAKRPWSEAGKLAMTSWNIQNKEYKTSHPDAISPHNQSNHFGAGQAPGSRKKRSRAIEVDEHGNPLRKKRGRPSKADKDHINEQQHHVHHPQLAPPTLPSSTNMRMQPTHGHGLPMAPSSAVPDVHSQSSHGVPPQAPVEGYSEEEEEGEGDEEEEEEEEEEGEGEGDEEEEEEEEAEEYPHSHSQAQQAPAGLMHPASSNGTHQVSPHQQATTDSEPEEAEDYEGSEASPNESSNHIDTKMRVQPSGILA